VPGEKIRCAHSQILWRNEYRIQMQPLKSVTINYEDGTHSELQFFAVACLSEDTWFNILSSPPKREAKIKMNNYLVELSNNLIESIGM
jgi:hypothetical protein